MTKDLHPPLALPLSLVLLGFAVRAYHLAQPGYRWDEGWSLALSTLPAPEILRITALDVHPPLYYLLLKAWLALGPQEAWVRFMSVVLGLLAVPLAYQLGRRWLGWRAGLGAALYLALAPIMVYYAQTARMYAMAATALLLAAYGLLRALEAGRWRDWLLFAAGGLWALYSFYYTAFALVALLGYGLLRRAEARTGLLVSVGLMGLGYAPWLWVAVPPMLDRLGARSGEGASLARHLGLLRDALFGLVFAYQPGWLAVWIVLCLAAVAFLLLRQDRPALLLPAAAVLATLVGVSLGAGPHMFAPRYTIGASPFLALLVAGGLAALWSRSRVLLAVGLAVLMPALLPASAGYVYAKTSEVSGPFDPATDHRYLSQHASQGDVAVFNVLSLAGTYQRYRHPQDPAWSYALRWDPVVKPLDLAKARVSALAGRHRRLWFVLYKGAYGPNEPLKNWLDRTYFPAGGRWQGDTLYALYVVPPPSVWVRRELERDYAQLGLRWAEYTRQSEPGGTIGLKLLWQARGKPTRDAKVFVHAYDQRGRLVAQHDSFPVNDLRPPSTWAVDEEVLDLHGLALPQGFRGQATLVVGLYDPQSGQRLRTLDGRTMLVLGQVRAE